MEWCIVASPTPKNQNLGVGEAVGKDGGMSLHITFHDVFVVSFLLHFFKFLKKNGSDM